MTKLRLELRRDGYYDIYHGSMDVALAVPSDYAELFVRAPEIAAELRKISQGRDKYGHLAVAELLHAIPESTYDF